MPQLHRLPILLALACALFVRALVPAGWMPAPSGGAFAIEPCPAASPEPVVHPAGHHGGKHAPSHKAGHDGDCAFAPLMAGFAAADVPVQLVSPALIAEAPPARSAAPAFATGPPAPPPPATGPPALA